jgi:phospholipid transport system substrate-binding protein
MMMAKRMVQGALGLAALMAVSGSALAQAGDPAAQVVDGLDSGLIATMKTPGGQAARARIIAPAVDRAFDIALMARLSVGPAWTSFAPSEQASVVSAFRAMTIAQYAANFDGYSGERFALVGPVETRGGDKLVRTSLTGPGTNEALNYRLRESGGQWKIIDVYYRNSISQLATRRSDFATVIAKGGASALVAHLNRLAANPK